MGMTANDLGQQRDAMLGNPGKKDDRTERIYKMFTPADAVALIKADPQEVTIGSGPEARLVKIRPLNPKQLLSAYGLIQQILVPIIHLFEPDPETGTSKQFGVVHLVNALGDNVEKIPELVHVILQRGNDVSKDWLDEHMDVLLDLQLIIPIFLKQNALDKLFGGNAPASVGQTPPTDRAVLSVVPPVESTMEASPVS